MAISGITGANSRIKSFEFRHIGTIGGDSHTYTVLADGDTATFKAEGMLYGTDQPMTCGLSAEELDSLNRICEANDVRSWNGFYRINSEVLDGSGFSLEIKYDDGTSVYAHGMNSTPSEYDKFSEQMYRLLRPKADALMAVERLRLIKEGESGQLRSANIVFFNEDDNADTYSVTITRESGDKGHVIARINSVSGRYFAGGKIEIDGPADVDWDELVQLIVKHRLTLWYEGERDDKEHPDNEWYTVDVSFGRDRIFSRGTLHPEGYEAFRDDFLNWLRDLIATISNDRK